jgi:hypothetical protein
MRPVASITWALAGTLTEAPTAVILPPLITTVPFGMSAPLTVTMCPPLMAKVPWGPGFGLKEPSWAPAIVTAPTSSPAARAERVIIVFIYRISITVRPA